MPVRKVIMVEWADYSPRFNDTCIKAPGTDDEYYYIKGAYFLTPGPGQETLPRVLVIEETDEKVGGLTSVSVVKIGTYWKIITKEDISSNDTSK